MEIEHPILREMLEKYSNHKLFTKGLRNRIEIARFWDSSFLNHDIRDEVFQNLGPRWLVPSEMVTELKTQGFEIGSGRTMAEVWLAAGELAKLYPPRRHLIRFGELLEAIVLWDRNNIFPYEYEEQSDVVNPTSGV